jgi:hypothetical protein
MSKLGCVCRHAISDQTDCLPDKAYLREDEDVEKPIELLADVFAQCWEACKEGREAEFIRHVGRSHAEPEDYTTWQANELQDKPMSQVLFHLINPCWYNYDRKIYECERCGHLWVEIKDGTFVSYRPATDTHHVLWSRHNHNLCGYLDD